jgi:hypothetical protein
MKSKEVKAYACSRCSVVYAEKNVADRCCTCACGKRTDVGACSCVECDLKNDLITVSFAHRDLEKNLERTRERAKSLGFKIVFRNRKYILVQGK